MLIGQQIEILDSTLREGEQTPGVSFTVGQKIALAKRLDTFGVDFIELGHPAVSPDCPLYISPSPRDLSTFRMPSSA